MPCAAPSGRPPLSFVRRIVSDRATMSKKSPISTNKVQRFMGVVYLLAEEFGIEEIDDVYHYVELLGDAVARHAFEQTHKVSPQKKVHNDRKRFIVAFKTRYQQAYDLEYTRAITPTEAKLVHQANKALIKEGFTADEYLKWVFEEFLPENPKLSLPQMKSVCSQFFLHSFITSNQEIRQAKKRHELSRKEGMDLIQRARGLLRSDMNKKDEKNLRRALKEYSDRGIMLSEFRTIVQQLEKRYNSGGK